MAEKTITLINNTLNPHQVKNSEGKNVLVGRGDAVTVLESDGKKLLRFFGMVDASKYVKPSSNEEVLAKKNAALEAELKALKEQKPAGNSDPLKGQR